jgi:integrase
MFLYFCGCRIGETLEIEWSQVDLKNRQNSQITLTAEQTKTEEARILPLPPVLVDVLKKVSPKEGRVFDGTNLRKSWMKACAACGLGTIIQVEGRPYDQRYEGLTIHDLRQAAIRNLRRAGVPETVAMKISGHKTRSVFDRYNIVDTEAVQNAMRAVVSAATNHG